jgi:NADH-quinone oxidoreductase subunit C
MSETTGMPRYTTPPRQPVEVPVRQRLAALAEHITTSLPDVVERTVVDRDELTLYVDRSRLLDVARLCRDDPKLRFEVLASLSGADYLGFPGEPDERRLHAVYHLLSMTYRHRLRIEVAVTAEDPHVPSVTGVWPTADWQERETYDFFGIVFDGHPRLIRIEMPDDWDGHPQRKDYPLGGVPVEYKGAQIPPPEQRTQWA